MPSISEHNPLERHLAKARDEARLAIARANHMEALIERLQDPTSPPIWRSTGRLTDAGMTLITEALDAGMTQADLTRWFDLSLSAANYHFQAWRRDRRRSQMTDAIRQSTAYPDGDR